MARKLILEILGDSSSLERALGRSTKATEQFQSRSTATFKSVGDGFTRLQKFTAGGLLAGGAFAGLKTSLDAASDLHEQMTKVGQVFQDSADETVAWSRTTADSFGISQRAALTAAGTFGNLFNTVGLAPQKAAAMSRSLTELAADLASFNNVDPGDALDALRSGLIGEAEPLRRFGVLLSETRVQQEAMRETGKTVAASLTDQEKALARYTIILKDTAPAHGDFARTSDGAANASRRLSANLADLQANLASGLVPTLGKVTGALASLTASMQAVQITSGQLASDKGLRDKFADAFGVEELFKALNNITSAGLANRPEEGAARAGSEAGKRTGEAVGDAFAKALEGAMAAAKGKVDAAIKKGQAAIGLGDLVDALDLNVSKATLTATLSDDLDALVALKAGLEKQIKAGVDVKSAQQRLVAVEGQIASAKSQVRSDAFSSLLESLQLGVDRASLTRTLADDVVALERVKAGLERQIKAGVDVAAAQSRLVQVEKQIADSSAERAKNQRDAARAATQAGQFRALGLAGTGDEIVPGVQNLARRLKGALSRIESGDLDVGSKLASRLKAAQKLIRTEGGKLTEETRRQIDAFLKAATGKDSKIDTEGPLTKGSGLNTKKILAGLGLDPDTVRELQSRLSHVNSSGLALAGNPRIPTGNFAGGQPIAVDSTVNVFLDGDQITRTVTRGQQVTKRRNPPQKRGPNRSGI